MSDDLVKRLRKGDPFADGKLYSMNPVLEAREDYRQARDATK